MNDELLDVLDRAKNDVARAVVEATIRELRRHGVQLSERFERDLHRQVVVRITVDMK
jgi:hypothetical protein